MSPAFYIVRFFTIFLLKVTIQSSYFFGSVSSFLRFGSFLARSTML